MKPFEKIKAHYEPRIGQFEESFRILDWESHEAQFCRFHVLTDQIDLKGLSVLDVGCGLADLNTFLTDRQTGCRYTGVDILDSMVKKAVCLHPDVDIRCEDILSKKVFDEKSFDLVYCCGIFNLNLGNNEEFLRAAMLEFLRLARKWVVINLLHKNSPDREEKYAYFDPDDIRDWFSPLVKSLRIVEGYLPNDFSVIIEP